MFQRRIIEHLWQLNSSFKSELFIVFACGLLFLFETVNHNKAWLFQGSFFLGGRGGGRVNLTLSFIFQEELIQYQLTS